MKDEFLSLSKKDIKNIDFGTLYEINKEIKSISSKNSNLKNMFYNQKDFLHGESWATFLRAIYMVDSYIKNNEYYFGSKDLDKASSKTRELFFKLLYKNYINYIDLDDKFHNFYTLLAYNIIKYEIKNPEIISIAMSIAAEKDSNNFIRRFSEEPLAKPYLSIAAKHFAKESPYIFIKKFSKEPWAQDSLDIAAKNMAQYYYSSLLGTFSEESFAQPYLGLAANNMIEEGPHDFLERFSNKPWANTPVDSIGGKTWVEYAREAVSKKEASSIDIKLKKLSRFLLNNKFILEESWIKKLIKI
jgi:hypothetical protein